MGGQEEAGEGGCREPTEQLGEEGSARPPQLLPTWKWKFVPFLQGPTAFCPELRFPHHPKSWLGTGARSGCTGAKPQTWQSWGCWAGGVLKADSLRCERVTADIPAKQEQEICYLERADA